MSSNVPYRFLMFVRSLKSIIIVFFVAGLYAYGASNKISSSTINVNEPLSDAEVEQILGSERWPHSMTVKLGADADDRAFESLAKIPRVKYVEFAGSNKGITCFDPIQSLPDLVKFVAVRPTLNEDRPWSLRPFANCRNLIHLNLNRTLVSHEDSLRGCTKLRYLNLVDSGVTSLSFLTSMPKLQDLYLDDSDKLIRSYAPLGSLDSLRKLSIKLHETVDETSLESLSKLTRLRHFSSSGSGIRNINFLANCASMERLGLSRSRQLEDIKAIGNMKQLRIAYLTHTKIDDLSVFADNIFLHDLSVSDTAVEDLAPLEHCPSLQKLNISGTAVQNLAPLERKPYFVRLKVANAQNVDLTTLPLLPRLEEVDMRSTSITDISPLARQPDLRDLSLQESAVRDLSALSSISGLERLRLSEDVYSEDEIDKLRSSVPMLEIGLL